MSGNPISRRRALMFGAAGLLAAPLAAGTALADPIGTNAVKVYLDPGHGGSDPGAVGNGLQEKNLTLDIALRTRTLLVNNWGVTVRMSRTSDIYRSLSYRSSDANSWGASLFVSIHINAGGGTGFESFRYTSTSSRTVNIHRALHPAVLSGMRSVASVTDRGLKTANFHVLRETSMSAILTENLFIDRASDAALLARADFRAAIARGHAQGIANALGL
ncbi:N-acetylmuramoyl-L-alanine amidase [Stackebrandtia albiflava]|uniref:N-acetylmuramoyl-L-alanine amidase n=1 Tax=Stackebrandtia albiflava TaxID=406432 RepID=A0A562V0Z7_9ACTN|nr:N-acetylmuramoyl-L-alanine amidase [Stackebrandtia albiflava]TWJ11482.1 N-acetylmuramoyl-L-alanine amidase [Stackebrandtia albiflava]